MKFLLGLVITIIGTFMTVKTETFLNSFGRIAFFDKYLGSEGGSRLGYKLLGLFAAFIGVLIMTGLIGGFIEWVFDPLLRVTPGYQPGA